jgi:UDPglucose--hexose-1-phosphate uridylyltransferase
LSEWRRDPVLGRWVIMAPERGLRPEKGGQIPEDADLRPCVFCAGQEYRDPSEIYAVRTPGTLPNTPGWQVRVLPNKFPALRTAGDLVREGVGLHEAMAGVGAHEVIVETPEHAIELADLPTANISAVLGAYRERMLELGRDPRFRYALAFKNKGYRAGATLRHPHSQLIAMPVTPKRVKEELTGARRYYQMEQRCVYCAIIEQEAHFGRQRVILESPDFVALAPYASHVPFEVWLLPRRHSCDFTSITAAESGALADMLKQLLLRLRAAADDPAFNYFIHTAPFLRPRPGYWTTIQHDYHWHLEIIPRLTRPAGFEEGSGSYINPVLPEEATALLRAAGGVPAEDRPLNS